MIPASWPCPLPDRAISSEEFALAFEGTGQVCLLIVPALFDEGNRLRRFSVEVQRRLADRYGIGSVLPDLPGCNESLASLSDQTITHWREAMSACALHFSATHALGLRGGCLLTPPSLRQLHYAPVQGGSILRQMLRARILSSREAGRDENRERLEETARTCGITLNGYSLGARLFQELESLAPGDAAQVITQGELGGSGLWLRAEPSEDSDQAEALARLISAHIAEASC